MTKKELRTRRQGPRNLEHRTLKKLKGQFSDNRTLKKTLRSVFKQSAAIDAFIIIIAIFTTIIM